MKTTFLVMFCALALFAGAAAVTGTYEIGLAQGEAQMFDAGPESTDPGSQVPDPVDDPSAAWMFAKEMRRLGMWPMLAAIVLMISRIVVARLKAKEGAPMPTGWRAKALAIGASLVAISGAGLELLLKTGSAAALATACIYAFGLLKDAFDPPRMG